MSPWCVPAETLSREGREAEELAFRAETLRIQEKSQHVVPSDSCVMEWKFHEIYRGYQLPVEAQPAPEEKLKQLVLVQPKSFHPCRGFH